MNDSIDKFLAPLENLSRHPKVRLLTWIVLVGSFIGDTLYSIVHTKVKPAPMKQEFNRKLDLG